MNSKIEFIDLKAQYGSLRDSINARIQQVLDHGQYIMGPEVAELERELSTLTGASHCITVSSGTEALLISLMALGVGPGDEVITTPFTFVATAEVIALVGATPVFVDVEADTCNIDASKVVAAITNRTKAIIPVSLYGQPADMDQINEIAKQHGLVVIEDAAQSFGATYKERKSCNLSAIGCTSFFPSKPLGCYGDGGAIFTNDDQLTATMREIRVHGQSQRYHHARVGVGGRMDTLQCAVVLAKLGHFEWEVDRRQAIASHYGNLLSGVRGIQNVVVRSDRKSIYAQYTVFSDKRDAVVKKFADMQVPVAIHYPKALHQQPAYRRYSGLNSLHNAEQAALKVLSLPMHPYLSESQIALVVNLLADASA